MSEASVILTARAYNGSAISGTGITNPATLKIPASGQRALRPSEIFGNGVLGKKGWIQVAPSTPAIRGFFLLFDSGLKYIDGADLQSTGASRLIFPKVSVTADSATNVSFVQTGSDEMRFAAFSLYENSGRIVGREFVNLPANGGFSGPVTDIVPVSAGFEGYAVLETTAALSSTSSTLFGFESYRNRSDIAVLTGVPDGGATRTGYLPHLASGAGYTTRLGLVNHSHAELTVKITAEGLEHNNAARSPVSVSVERKIPPLGRIEETADSLFSLRETGLTTGYIRFEVTGSSAAGVVGYLDYGTSDGLLSAVPAQAASYSDLFFSHVAEGLGYYTGVALLNPNMQASSVNVEVFDREGKRAGATTLRIEAGERRSRLMTELLPNLGTQLGGYVRITASRPVFAFQLFGSRTSLNFLANVSAQGMVLQPQSSGRMVSAGAGANVVSQDGMTSIAIPAGALESDTAITVASLTASALPDPTPTQKVVAAVQAGPSGTRFKIPVTLTFPLAAEFTPGTEVPVLIYNPATQTFQSTEFTAIVDDSGRTASSKVTHFTTFTVGLPAANLITVSSISPTAARRGATVTVTGTGFNPAPAGNKVTFAGTNNSSITAKVISATAGELSVEVPEKVVTGNVIVTVGGKSSVAVPFTVLGDNPVPSIASISPASAVLGATSVAIQIKGTNFLSSSSVKFNGSVVAATFRDSTLLEIIATTSQLTAGTYKISVTNPESTEGSSNTVDFTVGYPKPSIASISPENADRETAATVTITGTGFTAQSSVLLDSASQTVTYVNDTTLKITITSTTVGPRLIMVSNASPGGGASNAIRFTFKEPNVTPVGKVILISSAPVRGAPVDSTLSLIVEVQSAAGQPLSNKQVTFSVAAGGGSVSSSPVLSDPSGRAQVSVRLGTRVGANTFIAKSDNITSAGFTVLGNPGDAAAGSASAGTGQTGPAGVALATKLKVKFNDAFGNIVATGTTVTFSVVMGGGSVSPITAATDANGEAETTATLGGVLGAHNQVFRATAGAATVDFTATAVMANLVAKNLTLVDGNDQSVGLGGNGAAMRVKVTSESGVAVPAITVNWSVATAGGSFRLTGGGMSTTTTSISGTDGIASATPICPATGGEFVFSASASGLVGSPISFRVTCRTLTVSVSPINVVISSGTTKIGSYQVTINYDKSKVLLTQANVVGGTSPYNSFATVNIDNQAGTLTINQFTTSDIPSGTFVVARITFTPVAAGTFNAATSNVTLTQENGSAAPGSVALTLSATLSAGTTSLPIAVQ